jgi:hypothetical protein
MRRPRLPGAYRELLASPPTRLLLGGLGVSSLGDGISTVTIAWLAVGIAPPGSLGLYVGLAVAAYTLPGVIGARTLGPPLRGRPARAMVLIHCVLRAGSLGLMTLSLYQAATTEPNLPSLLAARSAVMLVSTPLGTALGGPIVGALGGAGTLVVSGVATMLLSGAGALAWRESEPEHRRRHWDRPPSP